MDNKYVLSLCIRDYELSTDTGLKSGYITQNSIVRENYLRNDCFNDFVSSFDPKHNNQYRLGDGGELVEKYNNRWKQIMPPKMAAFSSSSRMIYLLSKNIPDFEFEKQMRTNMGGQPANLDGYLYKTKYFFVEAKRSEIFDSHPKVRESYRDIFNLISNSTETNLSIDCGESVNGELKAKYFYDGKEIKHFDIKQIISHMLGISYEFLTNISFDSSKSIMFIYLLYDPKPALDYASSHNTPGLTKGVYNSIMRRYNDTVSEINSINMSALFKVIAGIQANRCSPINQKRLSDISDKFCFELRCQNDYTQVF